jgi:hypothetical protein
LLCMAHWRNSGRHSGVLPERMRVSLSAAGGEMGGRGSEAAGGSGVPFSKVRPVERAADSRAAAGRIWEESRDCQGPSRESCGQAGNSPPRPEPRRAMEVRVLSLI